MQTYHTKHRLPHSPMQMFDLVAAVEDYPLFLPLCEALTVKSRDKTGRTEIIIADMSVGYGPIHETFTSKVTLDRSAPSVLVEYLDGPFSHLENRWGFEDVPNGGREPHDGSEPHDGCVVDFYLAYEFRSRLLQMMMGAMFEKAFTKFVAAFEARALKVYGPATAAGEPGQV